MGWRDEEEGSEGLGKPSLGHGDRSLTPGGELQSILEDQPLRLTVMGRKEWFEWKPQLGESGKREKELEERLLSC